MRRALPLFLLLATVLPPGLSARDPSTIDASKQNTRLAPTPESADNPLAPSREANQRLFKRHEQVQEQRFRVPDKIERKDAIVGERRAPIDVKETRDKTIVDRKDYATPELKERKEYHRDRELSRIQPSGDQIKKYDMVAKYQDRMRDADTAAAQRQPTLEKRTSFDKLNRFIFKRNAPGSENGKPVVTTAGGDAPESQDTYTKYRVDWQRFDPPQ